MVGGARRTRRRRPPRRGGRRSGREHGVRRSELELGTAEVGYAIHPDHWGNGFATEAVAPLTRYAFGERRLEKLAATVYEHDPASMRVLEKAGWHEEAVLEREAFVGGDRVDLHRFAAHADGWESASRRARAALRA